MVNFLVDEGGRVVEGSWVKTYIADQYQAIFITQAGGEVEEVTSCVQQCVTLWMNNIL
jgi:hypothetical protein